MFTIQESSGYIDLSAPSPVAGHFGVRQLQKTRLREARITEATKMWRDWQDGVIDPVFVKSAMRGPELADPTIFEALCQRYPRLFPVGLRETMTTSDFSVLTADILDRALIANYTAVPIPIMPLFKQVPLRDFRLRKLFLMDGMETTFTSVAELEGVPQRSMSQRSPVTYAPQKYEAGTSVSWEAVINDDLGIFQELVGRLTRGAQRTIHKAGSSLYSTSGGPSSTLYTTGFKNKVIQANGAKADNPVLSVAGLQDALTVLFRQLDSGGDPIIIPGNLFLVVPAALFVTAKNIMNQILVDANEAGGTTNQRVRINNWLVSNFSLIMDPYMDIVNTTNGTTAWYVFADPAQQDRYAMEFGFLRGFDTPQLYQKMPNTMRIGGGVDPMLGDFQTMATEYKALLVFGLTIVDGRSTVASKGTNAP